MKPVAGMISVTAQYPFVEPIGVLDSSVTPTVISANDKNSRTDCMTEAFQ